MSSLIGQNIGGNPRGILNLGATINTPLDTTLRNVTDGLGNNSPLQLSTTEVSVSAYLSIGNVVNATGFGQRLRVIGQGDASIGVYRNQASSSPAKFEFMKSRGTYDVPLVVNNLDELGSLSYFGFNGTSYSNSARVYARAVSSTGTGVEGELLTTLWNNTGSNLNMLRLTILGLGVGNALDYTPSARLQVRGDGTNPHFLTQDSGGTERFRIGAAGASNSDVIFNDSGIGQRIRWENRFISITSGGVTASSSTSEGATSGTTSIFTVSGTWTVGAGSANYRPLNLAYTINNSGAQTGTATGIFLRSTETNLNGMLHNFIDLGTIALGSLFSVANNGAIRVATIADSNAPISSLYFSSTANKLVWKDAGGVVNNLY
jgi:hypothetical protein